MESFWDDLTAGARSLRRSPGFTATTAFILALGLAGSATLFSLLDALLLNPFPVRAPGDLVAIETERRQGSSFEEVSIPDFRDLETLPAIFAGVGAHSRWPFTIRVGSHTERTSGDFVSANYFDLLGVPLALGRGFDAKPAAPVTVISYGLFRRGFSGDPEALGKTIQVNGKPVTVIGVAPRNFRGVILREPPDLFIPLDFMPDVVARWYTDRDVMNRLMNRRDARLFQVVGRLATGVTLAEARAAVTGRAERLRQEHPDTNSDATFVVGPAREAWLPRPTRASFLPFLGILGIVIAFVLMTTCSNVANLLLVRALNRTREIAIRNALGASRARIARQILFENLLLYTIGLAIAVALSACFLKLIPLSPFVALDRNVVFSPVLDGRTLAFMAALTFGAGLLFGMIPALRGSTASLRASLTSGKHRLARGLVFAQAALAVTLLIGAVLFVRTLSNLTSIDPGFRSENVLLVSIDFNTLAHKYDRTRGMAFYEEARERIGRLPGVRSVTWAGKVPLASIRLIIGFCPHERKPEKEADWIVFDCNVVGPAYFDTLGIPLTRGRDFADLEREGPRERAIVNESMARQYWPDVDPVGRRFWVRGSTGVKEIEIIGVSNDVKERTLQGESQPHLYLSGRYLPEVTFHVKTTGDPALALPGVRAAVASIDDDVPLARVTTLRDHVRSTFARERLGAQVLAASASFSIVLAALGVFGVTSYSAQKRTHEVGIRMALGAEASDVRSLFLREGVMPVSLGVAVGLAASVALSRWVSGVLFGVPPTDLTTFVASGLALVAIATFASSVPARRASRTDPAVSLRHE